MSSLPTIPPPLACRRSGDTGPLVVCLHSSTGSQSQWRSLATRLEGRCRLLAPDLHGHGRSPAWPAGAPNALDVDANAVTALLAAEPAAALRRGVHLVGHSYGAAVALRLALRHPRLVHSLVLYEPVLFGLLARRAAEDPALVEIQDIARTTAALVRAGELDAAAKVFACYWGGTVGWRALDATQRAAIAVRIGTVPRHFEALFAAGWPPRLLQRLAAIPLLLLQGTHTRAPTRRIAELLRDELPRLRSLVIDGAGHLGPITAPERVADRIVDELEPLLDRPGFALCTGACP